MSGASLQVLDVEEADVPNDMAEIVRFVEDGKLSVNYRVTKINCLIDQMVKKRNDVFKVLQVA